jgi:hypothetical protein
MAVDYDETTRWPARHRIARLMRADGIRALGGKIKAPPR